MKRCEWIYPICLGVQLKSINARPEPGMLDPTEFIAPRNGFAMSFRDFVPHLMRVLDQLGMSLFARTSFIRYATDLSFRIQVH